MTDQTGPARQGPTERCTCGHTKRDHSGRRDHREKYGLTVAGRPWCHACEAECIYCPPDPEDPEDTPEPELTLEEARALADDLGLQLYRAQDALAFIAECCDIADREQRTITIADVREWLKGARCGRQLAADAAGTAGYCPSCGRGDVAPSAEEYEQQRQRAEQAEREVESYRAAETCRQAAADTLVGRMDAIRQQTAEGLVEGFEQLIQRAEQAEAALDRARQAQRRLNSALIAVSSRLEQPYPDDPRWTPWTRFVKPAVTELGEALQPRPAATVRAQTLDELRERAEADDLTTHPTDQSATGEQRPA